MRRKLVVVVFAVLALIPSVADAASQGHRTNGKSMIIGTSDRGDVYVQATRGGREPATKLFRFTPKGDAVPAFTARTRALLDLKGSATVVGNRVLISRGRQVIAVRPNGRIDRSFGKRGRKTFDWLVIQVAGDGGDGFYVASSATRFTYTIRMEKFNGAGNKVAKRTFGGQGRFLIKAASPEQISYVNIGESPEYGFWEDFSMIDWNHRRWRVNVERTENSHLGDVSFTPGEHVLVSQEGSVTSYGMEGRDKSFGQHGYLLCPQTEGDGEPPAHFTVDPAGRIVATGWSGQDCGVTRFLPDGRLDPSFDREAASRHFPRGVKDVAATESRIFVTRWDRVGRTVKVLAFGEDGPLDNGFGEAGRAGVPFGTR